MEIARSCVFCESLLIVATPAVLMPFVAHRALGYEPAEITEAWGLRDIRTGACHVRCSTVTCIECGGLFLDLRFGVPEMMSLYQDYRGEEYCRLRSLYEPGYELRNRQLTEERDLAWIEKELTPLLPRCPRILDWGGDDGRNTPLRETSALCHVFDISGKNTVKNVSSISQVEALKNEYDLVVLSHVLEHEPHPLNLLQHISSVLQESTLMYIEIPFEGLMARRDSEANPGPATAKRHWHEHINFFSKQALGKALDRAGLVAIAMDVHTDNRGSDCLYAICRRRKVKH